MASFNAPSFRAAQSDLAIQISPLGLIELSDEEFEVHGPRLNRYAHNWAFYLGHHWGYRREAGEPQITFNYTRALSDWMTNFTFGRGIHFKTPKETEAIVPALLQRVWEVDNDKRKILWGMGQTGSVNGDTFVKVAYEDPWVDPIGRLHEGKVRIIVLNPAFCFPEWHPHDRSRLQRLKIKYRFWGTAPDGTRQVFTYTEILTDEWIEEYINDELVDEPRRNPIGVVPVVHIANVPIEGSPWGLPDIQDVTSLNREFNEKATEISDIINYHAAPVTVITGAKASQLEKGAKRVWGGLPEKANVFNLELGGNLQGPLTYLELLKQGMHEMTGVPEGALGRAQPISNTSGVALQITYMPAMNHHRVKAMQYGMGCERINEMVMLYITVKEPHNLQYNQGQESDLKAGQAFILNPNDPITYRTETDFPPPLPTDVLIKLNEIQGRMGLGLESKRGALRELGEMFPDEKMAEIFDELKEDTLEQGALDLLRAEVMQTIAAATGMLMEEPGKGAPVESAGGEGVSSPEGGGGQPGRPPAPDGGNTLPGPMVPMGAENIFSNLVTLAHGTKLAQRRNPLKEDNT